MTPKYSRMVETQASNQSVTNGLKSNRDDISVINTKLYLLLQTTNIEISFDVFSLLMNLLRKGCTPEAVYLFLRQISSHSKILKKFKSFKKSQKILTNENKTKQTNN